MLAIKNKLTHTLDLRCTMKNFSHLSAATRTMTTLLWWKLDGYHCSPTFKKTPQPPRCCRGVQVTEHSPVWEWESRFATFLRAPARPKQAPWLMDPSSELSAEAGGVPQLLDTTPYSTAIFSAPSSHCLFPQRQRDYPGWLWVAALGGVGLLVLSTSQHPSLRIQQKRQQRTLSNPSQPKPTQPPPTLALADPTKQGVGKPKLMCSNNYLYISTYLMVFR